MMKYRILIGTFLLLNAGSALAQTCPPGPMTEMLGNTEPLGEYTKKVIERVNQGIQRAESQSATTARFGDLFPNWMRYVTGNIYALLDTETRLVDYQKDMPTMTACLHLDLSILEAKMEQVRCKMIDQIERGSDNAVTTLVDIQHFLNNRYKVLIEGATDPAFEDPDWQNWQPFDPPEDVWCCVPGNAFTPCTRVGGDLCSLLGGTDFETLSMCSDFCPVEDGTEEAPPAREALCPFDTDYLPPTSSGYGCDISVLERAQGANPLTQELEGLREFTDARRAFLSSANISRIKEAYVRILRFQGKPIPPELTNNTSTPADVEHKKLAGCSVADNPYDLPEGIVARELRGPFSIDKNHINIMRAFFDVSRRWGLVREIPYYLRPPSYYKEGTQEYEDAQDRQMGMYGIGAIMQDTITGMFQVFSQQQGGQEAAIYPKAVDTQSELMELMKPVRPVISTLAKSVKSPTEGMRGFAKNYAYFLRRSCIFRPCAERLDKVMKILFEDMCFPYVSGQYKESYGLSTWMQCQFATQL